MFIGLKDFIIAPLYLFIILMWAKSRLRKMDDEDLRKYFKLGLWLHVFGAIGFGLIYRFYYGDGDTFAYYNGARGILGLVMVDPPKLFPAFFSGDPDIRGDIIWYSPSWAYSYIMNSNAEVLTIRIAAVLNVLALNTYLSTSVLFGWLSFAGLWRLFLVFRELIPVSVKYLALSALCIPSVVFWGSGVMKDSITLAGLGFMTYSAWQIFGHGRKVFINALIILLSAYVVGTIKGYILLAFTPALLFFLINQFKYKLRSEFARTLATPAFVLVAVLIGVVFVNRIGSSLGKYSVENLETAARATQTWHTYVSEMEGGAAYTLGDSEFTAGSMLRKFLPAVNVTLFRPYLWEAREPIQLLSGLESAALLGLTLLVLFRAGPRRLIGYFTTHPFLQFCLLFSLIFAFAVGYTSYNFGALVRYKIPALPFYTVFILSLLHLSKRSNREKDEVVSK